MSVELKEPIGQLIRDPREFTKQLTFPDPAEIRIYDETLRDGEQMPGVCYTPEQKREIAKHPKRSAVCGSDNLTLARVNS